ncbi:type II secretion system F family protein [Gryllotalpicola ginsengisoli]|uniref:type II secretion system F family protein n=1 Tax=Gryllotalpicola ginsengisoli TaxID=444608 RepID=UPI0003B4B154|nr:type II secretion system F family protein [Gryllotalpicola ginsengisoli]
MNAAAQGALLGAVLGTGLLLIVLPAPRRRAPRPSRADRLRTVLLQAGLADLSPVAFWTLTALGFLLCASLAAAVIAVPGIALAAGCAGAAAPWAVVSWRLRRRRSAQRAAWPDVVDQLVAAARTGIALPDAVAALAHAGPEATRPAFERFGREYRATGSFSRCADRLKDELGDPVGDRIIETLKMAREVGGTELVGVLRTLGAALREDAAARAELQARQSWIVNAARLGVAAPWVVLALLTTRAEGRAAYATPAGTVIVIVAAVVSVIAYRVMIALGRLPEERRWFR